MGKWNYRENKGFWTKLLASVLILSTLRGSVPPVYATNTATRVVSADLYEGGSVSQNRVKNPFFTTTNFWTASGGTFTTDVTAANQDGGSSVGSWDASVSGQVLTSTAVAITSGDGNSNANWACSFRIKAATGSPAHKVQLWDGTNVIAEQSISGIVTTSGYIRFTANGPTPASGNVYCRLYATQDEPKIYISKAFGGLAEGFNVISTSVDTDWVTCTPTWTGSSSNPSIGNGSITAKCRRSGPDLVMEGLVTAGGTTTYGSGVYWIGLPSGYTVDDNKVSNSNSTRGWMQVLDNGVADYALMSARYEGSGSKFRFVSTVAWTATTPFTFGSGDVAMFHLSVPVTNWPASNVYLPSSGGLAAGDIVETASSSCPTGTIAADGSSLLRTDYPALFSSISTTYGSADGTHFTLPNAQGVFLRGTGTQGIHVGTASSTLQEDQFQGHYHQETVGATGGAALQVQSRSDGNTAQTATFSNTLGPTTDGTNGTPRTGTETRPANISVKICIRTVAASAAPLLVNSVTAQYSGATRINTLVSKSADYTATDSDETILMDSSGANRTVSLPAAANITGKKYIVRAQSSTNKVTIDPNASETVCGQTTVALYGAGDVVELQSDGTNWIGLNGTCERKDRAYLTNPSGTCAVSTSNGGWITLQASNGSGQCVWNLFGYSSAPTCTCSPITNSANPYCRLDQAAPSASSLTTRTVNSSAGGTGENDSMQLLCQGPR